jgi:thiamine kinase-like enzyme
MKYVTTRALSNLLIALIFLSCRTTKTFIDQEHALAAVQKVVPLSKPATIRELQGGTSQAKIFAISSDDTTYIVRFISHKSREESKYEIICATIASQEGYGPHLYAVEKDEGAIVIAFLERDYRSPEQRNLKEFYTVLAALLQRIHNGQAFPRSYNLFTEVKQKLNILRTKEHTTLPLTLLETIIGKLHNALTPHMNSVPCHYESAAQADPYIDIATVALSYCFNPADEKLFLATYLGRKPSLLEEAKLIAMKNIVSISYALSALKKYHGDLSCYENTPTYPLPALLKELAQGTVSSMSQDSLILFAKSVLDQIIKNVESQEFLDALQLLETKGSF